MARSTTKKSKTRNRFEKDVEDQLTASGLKFTYEHEKINYVLACSYTPDFVVETPTGRIYIEAKGYLRPEHKRKMCAVKRQHPNLDIRMLFFRRDVSYIRWAERNSFRYAIREIPQAWLDGF